MQRSKHHYIIKEYEGFSEKPLSSYYHLEPDTFSALESFVLANNSRAIELMTLSAKNYVGLITLNDGTIIEILPKIAGDIDDDTTRSIFLEMLKTLKDAPFKEFNPSHLRTEKLSILEIFIQMFLREAIVLSKQGLRAAYIEKQENEKFYKGKLLVSQNVRYNTARKDRFFLRYNEFNVNRPENRLIKSTLRYLLNQTTSYMSQREIVKLLSEFERVDFSCDYDSDFSKVLLDRTMKRYTNLLGWCKVFLKGNSFTAFAGSKTAIALLFPMEKIFESYVATIFKKNMLPNHIIFLQDRRYSLFDHPKKAFRLKPDIVVESGESKIVLDTKWKLLSKNERNHGISQSDMYQMYAYGKKYSASKVILIYPKTTTISNVTPYSSDDNVIIEISFIDLTTRQATVKSVKDILDT